MESNLMQVGVYERAVNVIDTASTLDFGPHNRVHRHLVANNVFYWVTVITGLLLFASTFECVNFGNFKGYLFGIFFNAVYWTWMIQWVIPRFWKKIADFLTDQHGPIIGDNWGAFINTLDIKDIIAIAQQFDCFTYDRMMHLASLFDDLSQKAKFILPLSPGFNTWASAIFGTLIGGLLLEMFKVATPLQGNIVLASLSLFTVIAVLYVFFCNGASRRHARTAALLREAAQLAPR